MLRIDRIWRALAAGLVALALAAGAAGMAFAAGTKDALRTQGVPALPEPLTREAVRDLVSRLSDDEVRKLLLDQLDRAAAATATAPKDGMRMVEERAGTMRTNYMALESAVVGLPQTLRMLDAKLTEPDGSAQYLVIAEILAALLASGWLAEFAYNRGLRRYRTRLRQSPATTFTADAFRRGLGLLLDVGGIVVWGLAAATAFLLLWHGHELRRTVILDVMIMIGMVRIAVLLGRLLLAPGPESERLLPFADGPAATLRRYAVALAVAFGLAVAARSLLVRGGAGDATSDLVLIVILTVAMLISVGIVWRVRAPIADLIRGDGKRGAVVGWLAELWPVVATVYLIGVLLARIADLLQGERDISGEAILSILLVVAVPIVDMALCRALRAAAARPPADAQSRLPRIIASYEAVFRRAIHIVVVAGGLALFGKLWEVDAFALAQRSMGGRIASSLVGICIVLLLAFMIWEIAKTAIDRRLAAEGKLDMEHPASRLRTLLPILRILIFVTIVVMATMSLLAALGVDILPLLAGASVVGVAIGFGSQTLVRDIVSGAFFLMDDAFRLGEYIEVGDAKGRVEKINVRSLFLRHHRGAINILPYGEIKRLRNISRDWMIMVMDFRFTYDTNLLTVKKIMKQVGEEIGADPELATDLLQPLKMGGVISTEDSAIVVRAKFTARPEGEPYMIRKAAYTKLLKAFRDAGIKFAHRQVTVYVPPGQEGNEAARAAAGAAALAAAADPNA